MLVLILAPYLGVALALFVSFLREREFGFGSIMLSLVWSLMWPVSLFVMPLVALVIFSTRIE